MSTNDKPLPCPFCKTKPKLVKFQLYKNSIIQFFFKCKNNCKNQSETFKTNRVDLVTELWNASVKFNIKKFSLIIPLVITLIFGTGCVATVTTEPPPVVYVAPPPVVYTPRPTSIIVIPTPAYHPHYHYFPRR